MALLLGQTPVSQKKLPVEFPGLSEEFLIGLEWKRMPETDTGLKQLLAKNPCIVDVDSLDVADIERLAKIRFDDGIVHNFWAYSKSKRAMELIVRGYRDPLIKIKLAS